jgi:hypothetical protein
VRGSAGQRVRSGQPVQRREQHVDHNVERSHQAQQSRDWQREQRVIGVEGVKRTEIVPADVERPVVVQQACAAALGELSAETEIFAQALLLGRFGHD